MIVKRQVSGNKSTLKSHADGLERGPGGGHKTPCLSSSRV